MSPAENDAIAAEDVESDLPVDVAPLDAVEAPAAAGDVPPGADSAAYFKDQWQRTEADLQNYRRRAQRDAEEARRDAEERVMLEIIAALDDLERALEAAREAGAPESWTHGVQLVSQRLNEFLTRQGVVALRPIGEPFDPQFHEALLEVEPPAGIAPGAVVQVALTGYRRGGRALRAARVVVAKRAAADEA
jgi:molecular chaperone GrpE